MNVLFITRKYPPQVGGMENFSYHLTHTIQCEKKVIALTRTQIHLLWFLPYLLVYTLINSRKYQIVHLGDGLLCIIGFWIKLVSPKVKVIMTLHGLDVTYANPIYQLYFKLFTKKIDLAVCVSRHTEEMAHIKGVKRTVVISNGIDVHKFKSISYQPNWIHQTYRIPKQNLVLLTVGRLVKRKGVAWFIDEVMPQLKSPVTYLVVGAGPQEALIQQLVTKHQLEGQVRLLGRIPDNELLQLYVHADLFIMPNIEVQGDMEGFGIVALEASLAGTLIVASGIEGIKDAIIDQKNGLLLTSKDAKQS